MTAASVLEPPRPLDDGEAELVEARLRSAARIEPTLLEEEFIRLPGDIAWWTARHAAAIGHALRAESYRKALRGLLWVEVEDRLRSNGEKPTVGRIEALVDSDPRYREALDDEATAEVEREKLKGAVNALMAKRDMLVQMGANTRAEMERDPLIRERARR